MIAQTMGCLLTPGVLDTVFPSQTSCQTEGRTHFYLENPIYRNQNLQVGLLSSWNQNISGYQWILHFA